MTVVCTDTSRADHRNSGPDFALAVLRGLRSLAAMPGQWRQRAADLRHLRGLDDFALADMGLTRADVEREAHMPFWRPLGRKRDPAHRTGYGA